MFLNTTWSMTSDLIVDFFNTMQNKFKKHLQTKGFKNEKSLK